MGTTIDVARWIDQRKVSRFQIQVLILCVIVMIVDGYDALSIGYVVPLLATKWGVAKPAFGPVFSAGLVAMALGALLFGALADRFGRRNVILFCLGFVGIFNLLKVVATSVESLLILQFVAGLGVGGVMPNAYALMTEYAPKARRALMVTIVGLGYAIGSSGAGLIAAKFITSHGWQFMFYVGGIAPLVTLPFVIAGLPESIRFLALRQGQSGRLERILKKIDSALPAASEIRLVSSEEKGQGVPVVQLFRHRRAPTTVLLWIAAFMDLCIIYFMTPWLPVMLHDAGFTLAQASLGTAVFSASGIVGGPTIGRMMDRFGGIVVLALTYGVAAVFIVLIGSIGGGSFAALCLIIFGAGFCAVGGHLGIGALASNLYPTFMRSTGVGWALGIGRFCSGISPMIGAWLIARHWSHSSIFSAVAVPACFAALAIIPIQAVHRPESAPQEPAAQEVETEPSQAG